MPPPPSASRGTGRLANGWVHSAYPWAAPRRCWGRRRWTWTPLVLESVYPDIDAALANRLRAALGGIVGPLATPVLAPLFKLLLPPILGVQPAELRPVDRIGEVRAPVLVAAGTADDRTTLAESQDLFAHVQAPGTFWPVPGAGHEDLQRFDPVGYERVVLAFLDQHLRQAP